MYIHTMVYRETTGKHHSTYFSFFPSHAFRTAVMMPTRALKHSSIFQSSEKWNADISSWFPIRYDPVIASRSAGVIDSFSWRLTFFFFLWTYAVNSIRIS